jgi:hypothetical protein
MFLSQILQSDKGVLFLGRAGLGTSMWNLEEKLMLYSPLSTQAHTLILSVSKEVSLSKFLFHFDYPPTHPNS